MFSPKHLISWVASPQEYIWIKAILLKETPRAIKILFDGKEIWLPRVWIVGIKLNKGTCNTIKIKISEYNWTKKF